MNSVYDQIITKLTEMDYIHFTEPYEFKGTVIHLSDIYILRNIFIDTYGKETFNQMIQEGLISVCNSVSTSNRSEQKKLQFIKWFNETYMNQ